MVEERDSDDEEGDEKPEKIPIQENSSDDDDSDD
jgi:hypothetical protein